MKGAKIFEIKQLEKFDNVLDWYIDNVSNCFSRKD